MRAALLAVRGGRAIWTAARATASDVIRPARSMKTVAVSLTLTSGDRLVVHALLADRTLRVINLKIQEQEHS